MKQAPGAAGHTRLAPGGSAVFDAGMKHLCRRSLMAMTLLALGFDLRAAPQFHVYFGTYTGKASKGIYAARLDAGSGKLTAPELVAETTSPSFLAIAPNGKFLYAANEVSTFEGKSSGAVSAFALDQSTGKLTPLNQVSSGGGGPCHIVVDATGKTVLIANYGGGSVASYPVNANGSLGETGSFIQHAGSSVNKGRQSAPHGHCIVTDRANRFALACDLGLDQVLIYKLDAAKGRMTTNDPPFATVPPGSGPRHLTFRPDGRFAYVINEMTCTMTAFRYESRRGALTALETVSTLPDGESMKPSYSTAEVEAHPSGRFLYGSNRGHDTIAVFAIDASTGVLKLIENVSTGGKTPRSFGIDPTGRWLLAANQNSNTVVVFRIDPKTGRLSPTGDELSVGAPVCVKFTRVK